MTIDEIFRRLSKSDQKMLKTAFTDELQDVYVEYEPGRFLGVNIQHEHCCIEQEAGLWSEGVLTGHTIPFRPLSIAYQPFEGVEHA